LFPHIFVLFADSHTHSQEKIKMTGTTPVHSFHTEHEEMIHDIQMDYYGKQLATCSSDGNIKIYELANNKQTLKATLSHSAPIWQISWSHPKFGPLLAGCSYDASVIIWTFDAKQQQWQKIFSYKHEASVNSIQWAPFELGLSLAAASSDNYVSVISYSKRTHQFEVQKFPAHTVGCNSVSWAPSAATSSLLDTTKPYGLVRRLVTGGSDRTVKVWINKTEDDTKWKLEAKLDGHQDWVRDVAWAPNIGLPYDTIATCSQDGSVIIWNKHDTSAKWTKKVLHTFKTVVWRCSWSETGNILAVSSGDNSVTLWKEGLSGKWENQSTLSDITDAL